MISSNLALRPLFIDGGRVLRNIIGAGVVLAMLYSCGSNTGNDTNSTKVTPNFSSLYSNYFKGCATCHVANTQANSKVPNLLMGSAADAYKSLKSNDTSVNRTACASLNYVNPSNPNKSILVANLDSDVNDGFQAATGTSCAPLKHAASLGGDADTPSAAVLTALKTWITNGADND